MGERPQFDLAVRGTVVTDAGVAPESSVAIADGKIAGIGLPIPLGTPTLGKEGLLILPGIVDAHVHALLDPREGFERTTRGAVAGGVTTIIDQPLDPPDPVTSPARLREKRALVEEHAYCDVGLLGGVTSGIDPDLEQMAEAGAIGFKHYMVNHPAMESATAADMLRSFPRLAELDLVACVHAEEPTICASRTSAVIASGRHEPEAHCDARPPIAEIAAVAMVLEVARDTGAHIHFHHVTVPRSFELISAARAQGVQVSSEICLHYLLLSREDMDELGGFAKINPPLRDRQDRDALWRIVEQGTCDIIATDHAPKAADEKQNPDIFKCSPGIPQVEVLLPLMFSHAVAKGRFGPRRLAQLLAENPSRQFGLWPQKGAIRVGADADLVIFDPECSWQIDGSSMQSFCGWSPYDGQKVTGRVVATIVRGRVVYEEGTFAEGEEWGRVIEPTHVRAKEEE